MLRSVSLGDLLTIVPAMRALERAFGAMRYLTVAPWLTDLARHARLGEVFIDDVAGFEADPTDIVALETAHLRSLSSVPFEPDVACNFRGHRPATYQPLLDLRPRRFIGFMHPDVPETFGSPAIDNQEHEVLRFARLLEESGVPCDATDLHIDAPDVDVPTGAIVLHPGAGAPSRHWPLPRWAALARFLADCGHTVIVTGSGHERQRAGELVELADHHRVTDLSGRTPILLLTALVARSRLVVAPDTGVGHLATATRTPSVLLFGPTPPSMWGPPPWLSSHHVIWKGRLGDGYGAQPDPGLLDISTDEVIDVMEQVIGCG